MTTAPVTVSDTRLSTGDCEGQTNDYKEHVTRVGVGCASQRVARVVGHLGRALQPLHFSRRRQKRLRYAEYETDTVSYHEWYCEVYRPRPRRYDVI